MIIYLYVKTHSKTGLKYLGKTTSKNPHRYTGSGVYWRNHLKKYGHEYTTEIIRECQTKEELTEWGLYYSRLWNIVSSDEWANLTEESGGGGNNGVKWTEEMRASASLRNKGQASLNKGKTYEEMYGPEKASEKIQKFKETYKKKAEIKPPKEKSNKLPHSRDRAGISYEELYGKEKADSIRAKQKGKLAGSKNPRYGKPGTFTGRKHSEEALAKMKKPQGPQKNPRQILTCPHCKKTSDSSNAKRWHFDNCKSKI